MKKRNLYKLPWMVLGIIIMMSSVGRGQSDQFLDMFLEPMDNPSGNYKNMKVFELGNLHIITKEKKATDLTIIDKERAESIFSFHITQNNARLTHFKFFKSEDESQPVIMMADVYSNHSLGQEVFLIKENVVTHSGFIEFAADDFNFSALSLYSQFEMNGDNILLTFQQDIDIIDLVNEEIINSSNLRYEIQGGTIRRVMN